MAELIQFDDRSGARIGRAVRFVEDFTPRAKALTFDRIAEQKKSGTTLHVGTFTGSWFTGTYKTVTLLGSTSTARVYNWCNQSISKSSETKYVIYGKANGTNSVVEIAFHDATQTSCSMTIANVDLAGLPGYVATDVQMLGHSAADATTNNTACATLTWYSITTCATSTVA